MFLQPLAPQLRENQMGSSRAYGQHFLVDTKWKDKIISLFNPPNGFAEIGPGKAALTKKLAERYSDFYCFEIDKKMAEFHEGASKYEIILQDFLDWDYSIAEKPVRNFSLIGNLPYESGTRIVLSVVEHADQISHFVFMLQKEVVERMTAVAGSRSFGSLSVLVQSQYEVKASGTIPEKAFRPPPKVKSAVISAYRRRSTPHPNSEAYRSFLRIAFQQKRKSLRNCLKKHFSSEQISEVFEKLKLGAKLRAEELPVDEWPKLFDEFEALKNG